MRKSVILSLVFVVIGMMSCNTDILPDPKLPEYFVIEGDTVKVRNDKEKLGDLYNSPTVFGHGVPVVGDTVLPYINIQLPKPHKQANLALLKGKENEGQSFRLLTIWCLRVRYERLWLV